MVVVFKQPFAFLWWDRDHSHKSQNPQLWNHQCIPQCDGSSAWEKGEAPSEAIKGKRENVNTKQSTKINKQTELKLWRNLKVPLVLGNIPALSEARYDWGRCEHHQEYVQNPQAAQKERQT